MVSASLLRAQQTQMRPPRRIKGALTRPYVATSASTRAFSSSRIVSAVALPSMIVGPVAAALAVPSADIAWLNADSRTHDGIM